MAQNSSNSFSYLDSNIISAWFSAFISQPFVSKSSVQLILLYLIKISAPDGDGLTRAHTHRPRRTGTSKEVGCSEE